MKSILKVPHLLDPSGSGMCDIPKFFLHYFTSIYAEYAEYEYEEEKCAMFLLLLEAEVVLTSKKG